MDMNVERSLGLNAGLPVKIAAFLAWIVSLWFPAFIDFDGLNAEPPFAIGADIHVL